MTLQAFAAQMERLKETFGTNSYKGERNKLIFNAVKNQSDGWMELAVTHFIGTRRQAPLLTEFIEELEDSKTRERQYDRSGVGSPIALLQKVAVTTENKEFARFCVQALSDKVKGKITKQQFWNEVMPMIDETAGRLCPGDKRR